MVSSPKTVSSLFDNWAQTDRADGMERGHSFAAKTVFNMLCLQDGQSYLDIGCGNGYSVRWAAHINPSGRNIGIDVSEKMVDLAKQRSTDFPNTAFHHSFFPTDLFSSSSLDVIFSVEAVYYMEVGQALTAIADTLRNQGIFAMVIDYYQENTASHSWPEDVGVSMQLLSTQQWIEAFRVAGLEPISSGRIFADPKRNAEKTHWKYTQGSFYILAQKQSRQK